MKWSWPGNVRELANFVERAVVCSQGRRLEIGEFGDEGQVDGSCNSPCTNLATWEATERNTILNALRTAKGRISGSDGAAALLGLKRTTLHSKMHRLKIRRADCL
jgi:transcriptional regulator of acetoin/glycerol metabolism